jgi:outer membrane protein TolC
MLQLAPGSFKIVPPKEPATEMASEEQMVNQAVGQRPELQNLTLTSRAASEQVRSQWLRWSPTLSAFGNIHLTNATGFSGRVDYYAAGLQLDWQLFDGFVRDAQRHQYEAQLRDAQLRLSQLHDSITDDVIEGRRQVLTSRQRLLTEERSVQLAKEVFDVVRVQYEAGTATQLELLTAQNQLFVAGTSLVQARFNLSLAVLNLRKLTGESLSGAK